MMGLLIALVIFLAAYLWLIAPCKRNRPDDSMLRGWRYAHRGLHDGNIAVPENSLRAFEDAVNNGYGIELDVQLTRDKKLVVHHDATLKRVCGVDKRIREVTWEELCAIPLPDGSRVPLFSEVLSLVDGRVPLIVEIKHYGGPAEVAAAALEELKSYSGPFCVESFNPLAMLHFRQNAPQIVRGQLAMGGKRNAREVGLPAYLALRSLLVNAISRPHFVAYSVPTDRTVSMWLMKRVFKPYLACWTVRSQDVLDYADKQGYQYPIFELFTPKKAK